MNFTDLSTTSTCVTEDLDIYSDLITTENDQSEITKKYDDLQKVCAELKQTNENLEKQNKILLENISKLYKTAKYELYQKNLKLKGMKEHLDAVIFRRVSKHGNYSSSAKTVGQNFQFNNKRINNNQKSEHNCIRNSSECRKLILPNNSDLETVINSTSETLMQYYTENNKKVRKKGGKMSEKGSNESKRTKIEERNVKSDEKLKEKVKKPRLNGFNHRKSDVVVKADAIKRRIRRNSVSPRKHYDCKRFSPRQSKRKEIEDGEIESDGEEMRKSERKVRKFDVEKKVNGRSDYEHQLELNRIKMQMRRENVLKDKAREMSTKDRKYR